MATYQICTIENCKIIPRYGNICDTHIYRMKEHGSYDKPSRKKYDELCKVEGCNKIRDGRHSVCGKHRVRWERYKSYDLPTKIKSNLPEGIIKVCKIHGELRDNQVYLNPNGKYQWPQCIECKKKSNYAYHKRIPNRHRNKELRNKYEELFISQDGKCAICKKHEMAKSTGHKGSEKTKRLAIDHDHKTGLIRGLLCHSCNTGIGALRESTEILEAAILYLKSHT